MTYPFRYNDCLRSSKCVDILGQGDCMLLIYILIYILIQVERTYISELVCGAISVGENYNLK